MIDPEAAEGVPLYFLEPAAVLTAADAGTLNPRVDNFVRGDSLILSAEIIEANTGRTGVCTLLWDDLEQREQWGRVRWVLGEWPAGEQVIERGSVDAELMADRLRAQAYANHHGDDLQRELRRIHGLYGYGSNAQVSTTLYTARGDRPGTYSPSDDVRPRPAA